MFELADRQVPCIAVPGQEAHGNRIVAGRRQVDAGVIGPAADEGVWNLNETSGAIADKGVGPDCPAVVEIDQNFQAAGDDFVRLSALDICNKAHAARVMLVARII